MAKYGLIGKNIDYSFSRGYFAEKFKKEQLDHTYENIDLQSETALASFLTKPLDFKGLNVTIPYKSAVIPYLDMLEEDAEDIGAVNTIKILDNGLKLGYNTDHYGFKKALEPFLPLSNPGALILGTGGASAAIAHVLANLEIRIQYVSRKASEQAIAYSQVDRYVLMDHSLIVNCTPLGTYPKVDEAPDIPYQFLGSEHLLFDLVYNPEITKFMQHGLDHGARVSNGYQMLINQAEKAWEIWNS